MPFDGTGFAPNRTVEALDKMAELLGPNGEHWCKEHFHKTMSDGSRSHCLIGAMNQAVHRCDHKRVLAALVGELSARELGKPRREHVVRANDEALNFAEVRRWLAGARARAMAPCPR